MKAIEKTSFHRKHFVCARVYVYAQVLVWICDFITLLLLPLVRLVVLLFACNLAEGIGASMGKNASTSLIFGCLAEIVC